MQTLADPFGPLKPCNRINRYPSRETNKMRNWISRSVVDVSCLLLLSAMLAGDSPEVFAQGVVPGTGQKVDGAGDDFEDENWTFPIQRPKSSYNIDKRVREPIGVSSNGVWFESRKRGGPDIIERVPTPKGGLPGSKGAMRMQSLYTGVPNAPSHTSQQDDLITDMSSAFGYGIPVEWSPSVVVRVYLPPFEKWEDATDTSFGFRASVSGIGPTKEKYRIRRLFRRSRVMTRMVRKYDTFYPGMFIQFNSKTDEGVEKDSAVFIIRGDDSGGDFMGPEITKTGWWTLGMSFTADGRVHYYAKPGVDDLRAADHIGSHFSQSVRCQRFNTIFFNICNQDNGRNWSTEWIIDDPSLYVHRTSE